MQVDINYLDCEGQGMRLDYGHFIKVLDSSLILNIMTYMEDRTDLSLIQAVGKNHFINFTFLILKYEWSLSLINLGILWVTWGGI